MTVADTLGRARQVLSVLASPTLCDRSAAGRS